MDIQKSPSHIPDEIVEEILSRLGVKSLLRFRCVSKSWRYLIDSQRFIKTHHQNLRKNTSLENHRIIHNCFGPKQYYLESLLNKESIAVDPFPFDDPGRLSSEHTHIMGCCNGLLCVLNRRGRFSLWNPAVRRCRELPVLPEIVVEDAARRWYKGQGGFGWDESSGAYKVIVGMLSFGKRKTRVYSSETDSWKTIESPEHFRSVHGDGMFVGGKLHWNMRNTMSWFYLKDWDYIVSFDLESEVFGRMELPCDSKGSYWSWLGEVEGCLSVVFGYYMDRLDVWVMKEYGVKESWDKVMVVPFVYKREPNQTFPDMAPIWIGGVNGEILLTYDSYFLVYYPHEDLLLPLKEFMGSSALHLYVESLVSPATHKNNL